MTGPRRVTAQFALTGRPQWHFRLYMPAAAGGFGWRDV
jgi:hypothetical protein